MNGNGDGNDVHFTLLASFLGSNSFFASRFTTFGSSTSVRKVMLLFKMSFFQDASICQVAAHDHHWEEGRHHESWEMHQSIHYLDD